jgi:hypothetical protein
LSVYDELLEQVKAIAEAHQSKAKEYIPKMYWTLRNEDSNFTPEDARDRIEKDCVGIWSSRTLLDASPDEAKDVKKQKAGRLRQKEANSAALTAAFPQKLAPVQSQETNREEIAKGVQDKHEVVVDNSTSSTLEKHSSPQYSILKKDDNETIARVEYWFPIEDMRKYIQKSFNIGRIKDRLWFSLIVDTNSGIVLSASIGKDK